MLCQLFLFASALTAGLELSCPFWISHVVFWVSQASHVVFWASQDITGELKAGFTMSGGLNVVGIVHERLEGVLRRFSVPSLTTSPSSSSSPLPFPSQIVERRAKWSILPFAYALSYSRESFSTASSLYASLVSLHSLLATCAWKSTSFSSQTCSSGWFEGSRHDVRVHTGIQLTEQAAEAS